MSQNSVIPLIIKWEQYTESKKSTNLYEFAQWLLHNHDQKKPTAKTKAESSFENEEYLAANYLSRLNKYVKAYVKPLFHDNQLANSDEFSILSLISLMDRPTKREVCLANVMEVSTGTDMIRRLIKANYIKEEPHEKDTRAKRLTLTKEGGHVLTAVYKRLAVLEQKVLADLNKSDKKELLRILDHLNTYHQQIYMTLT